ncbi:hypothetical protein D915_007764 [Fasciola hepatica]|uniref:Uncharacterized protein n=1 Tax=Fasciola hepatica TaxID=6192 RepID=A0A4E0R143_FASHE|nr:hypothetical protein D915_007764 [Fasciola hepatica]
MDDTFKFEDDLFEERALSIKKDIPYSPLCSGNLEFLKAHDVESQKAACNWFYLHGRYNECLEQADLLLSAHAEDVGGFVKKSYLDCKIRCCLRLGARDSLASLLSEHALAIVSREDLLSHFVLHQDYSRQTGDNRTLLRILQYLILFLPLGCVSEKFHQERSVPPCQMAWWSQIADLWTKVQNSPIQYYPPWFTTVARVFASLTATETCIKSGSVDTIVNHCPKEPYENLARQILLQCSSEVALEVGATFPASDCPLCIDLEGAARLARIFYERYVAPFETVLRTEC